MADAEFHAGMEAACARVRGVPRAHFVEVVAGKLHVTGLTHRYIFGASTMGDAMKMHALRTCV